MKARRTTDDTRAGHARQPLLVADQPRVHRAAIGSLVTGLLGLLTALADVMLVYRQYSGMASKGEIDHSYFGLSSMLVSLFAIVFGIQALYIAHHEPRWRTGNGFAITGLVLGSLPVLYYGLLFSLLIPYYPIAVGAAVMFMLVVLLLRLALRLFRSHSS